MIKERQLLAQNAALKEELAKRKKILSSIYKISQLLIHPNNHARILRRILQESHRIFGFTRSVILLLNKDEDRLEATYCIGFTPEEEARAFTRPLYLKTHICRETIVAKTGKNIYVRDIKNDPSLTEYDRKMERVWKRISSITVPLKINREIIGIIEGDKINEEMVLSKNDIRYYRAYANQASLILENARLYAQVLEERNNAHNILESAPNGIITLDEQKKVRSINRKAEEILRMRRTKVLGRPLFTIIPRGIANLLDESINNKDKPKYIEVVANKANPIPNVYGINLSVFEAESAGTIMTIQDITEIKQTEAMLRRIENLSSLGRMSASIAHEIRNPLTSINFNTQLLSKRFVMTSEMDRIIKNILEGIERIKVIIKRTMDLSRNISLNMVEGDIHDVISDSIALTMQQLNRKDIELKYTLFPSVPKLLFDPHQIRNVFINLLLNAIDAMPQGGVVHIKSCVERRDKTKPPEWFLVTFSDNGQGIPQETQKRIFDPFFTTKQEGTGLGLSIVHKILGQHNALIDIKSKENKGTSFYLRFPLGEGIKGNDTI